MLGGGVGDLLLHRRGGFLSVCHADRGKRRYREYSGLPAVLDGKYDTFNLIVIKQNMIYGENQSSAFKKSMIFK